MKKTGMFLLLLAMSILLMMSFSACGGKDGGSSFLGGEDRVVCPLDGQTVESGETFGDYVLITSIDNGAASEPQSGIGKADLLIEVPV